MVTSNRQSCFVGEIKDSQGTHYYFFNGGTQNVLRRFEQYDKVMRQAWKNYHKRQVPVDKETLALTYNCLGQCLTFANNGDVILEDLLFLPDKRLEVTKRIRLKR